MATANKPKADNAHIVVATSTDAASVTVAPTNVAPLFRPTLVKILTKPLFKWEANVTRYYRADGAMFTGKPINEGAGKPKKDPAILMYVTDLETGEQGQCICAAVLRSILNEEYPEEAYVGKSFAIKQHKIAGKDYNGFDVAEIEGPAR